VTARSFGSALKVLHIIDSGGLYGAEAVLITLAREQMKLGIEVAIASIGEKGDAEKPLETEALRGGVEVKKFRMKGGLNVLGALEILRYAHKGKFGVLHAHGYKPNILFGFLPRKFRKLPLVSTVHGWTSTRKLTKMRVYEIFDSWSLRFIDGVVVVSKAMMSLQRIKRLENLHVINNGISLGGNEFAEARIDMRGEAGKGALDQNVVEFCKKGFVIGSIGRLSDEKGYAHLVEALGVLAEGGVDARLVIIGEGGERTRLRRMARGLGVADRILMPGYREKAKNYLWLFNVYVISSLTEGLPVTLLEAMEKRVPVVATNVGGIPEALGYGKVGVLVAPGNPRKMAEGISGIYKNPELGRTLAEGAFRKVVSEYDSRVMARKYVELYDAACNGGVGLQRDDLESSENDGGMLKARGTEWL
jgi:glycosyltransferase involved in cell wall biosynthesis